MSSKKVLAFFAAFVLLASFAFAAIQDGKAGASEWLEMYEAGAALRVSPSMEARELVRIHPFQKFEVLDGEATEEFARARYRDHEGFITRAALLGSRALTERTAKHTLAIEATPEGQKRKARIKSYKPSIRTAVLARRLLIGMTEEQVRDSWGEPMDINRTETSYGVREQWVYPDEKYAYFEDGVLTAIQD